RPETGIRLELEERETRGVVELAVDLPAVVLPLGERRLRIANALRRGVERVHVARADAAAPTQRHRLLDLDGARCTGGDVHVAPFGQQAAKRGEDVVRAL